VHMRWHSEECVLVQHYLIVGYGSKGLMLPTCFSDSGEEVMPVFSSEEAAETFLALSSLGEGWYVKGFSGGELVSVLFAFHVRMKGIVLDPHPGVLSGQRMVSLLGRDTFVKSLLEARSLPSHRPHTFVASV
jgi:hypothetical protein